MQDVLLDEQETTARPVGQFGNPHAALEQALANYVLPRVIEKKCGVPEGKHAQGEAIALPERVQSFDATEASAALVSAILDDNRETAKNIVQSMLHHNHCRSKILTDVFAPVAYRLGEMWCDDSATFGDVTMGVGMLTSLMRDICDEALIEQTAEVGKNALMLSSADGHHQFGVHMICQLLRLQGWAVRHITVHDMSEVYVAMASLPYCFVGLSVSRAEELTRWQRRLKRLRACSCNRDVKIIVGGPGVSHLEAEDVGPGPDAVFPLDTDAIFHNGAAALSYVESVYLQQQHASL